MSWLTSANNAPFERMGNFDIPEQRGDLSDAQLYHMAPRGCYVIQTTLEAGRPELAPVIGRARYLNMQAGLARPRLDETFGALNLTEPV